MNKSSSFNVKDLLDLPESKDACSPVSSASPNLSLGSVPDVPDVVAPGSGYYDPDNPYTRWLQHNENMQYSGM